MQEKVIGNAVVNIQDSVIHIIIDDTQDPITVPSSRYPDLNNGDRVLVSLTSVDVLKLKKV